MNKSEGVMRGNGFWAEHVRACEASDGTMKAYAREHGLSVHSLYSAKKRLKSASGVVSRRVTTARFVELTPAPVSTMKCRVRLSNGSAVELEVSARSLRTVLDGIAALP